MPGSFTVSLSELASVAASVNIVVVCTVTSVASYKGNVSLSFFALTSSPPPDYISPTSASVYVPKNGSVETNFTVGLPVGASVIVEAIGSDASGHTASGTITLDA